MNKVGFVWACPVKLWDKSYEELVIFSKENGHARVPWKFPPNLSLGNWVRKQRVSYKLFLKGDSSSTLTEHRIHLLTKVGFEWDCFGQTWTKFYDELVSFVTESGHALVPSKFPPNPRLGVWVSTQRRNYKKFLKGDPSSSMTEDRIQLLKKIGFKWAITSEC